MSANAERLRAAVRLLYPEEITPQAKRILLSVADAIEVEGETINGEPITVEQIESWADEAERGHDR